MPLEHLRGQARVIGEVRRRVDAWRGFALGRAAEAYPSEAPRYTPVVDGERAITQTTLTLLLHWFRQEPHILAGAASFKYWPHQRRLVETFIYLYEVCGIRRTEQLYALAGVDPLEPQRDPWAKLGGQLATGSGKTKMMALLIAWAYLNAVREPDSGLGFGRHSILVAPGLFVRDRLLQDFAPVGKPSVFFSDPVVPAELEPFWKLRVYSPETCPRTLEEEDGALVVTNYHQLLRTSESSPDVSSLTTEQRQLGLLFESGDPSKLEAVDAPLIERFAKSRGLLILNDEAHHVWDETGHAKFEQKSRDKAKLTGEDAETAMAWIRCIRRLHGTSGEGRVALQADLSATLFEEQGTKQKAGATEFRPSDLFRHTAVHYGLAEAISDGIVKKPILERVVARNKKTGEPLPLVVTGAVNAWEKYKNLIAAGIERWKKVQEQLLDEGDARKPILFILCNDRNEAREVANYLGYGEAVRDNLVGRTPTGYTDAESGQPLFVAQDADGVLQSTVVEIHIGQKEQANEAEWEKVRQSVNAIDHEEIPHPRRLRGEDGQPIMVPNPYNVVVSVMMLKEGWDVRNVKVIVPLRPCDSRTLTEQTLGRGLRKMHAPILDDEGAAELRSEDLFVIEHPSFSTILSHIQDVIEQRDTDEIDHAREYVPILQNEDEAAREQVKVPLARFEGLVQGQGDWSRAFEMSKVPPLAPKIAWLEDIAETEIRTYLKKALTKTEEEGQTFSFPANPTFRDFEHVLEEAYVVPLLRDLRASFQYKTAVRGFVREMLETRTFALPLGIPISFARIIEAGDGATIALGNLARPEVMTRVREALLPRLREAINSQRTASQAVISRRTTADLGNYQAIKKHVLSAKKSSFTTVAVDSDDELEVASLLDRAPDVAGWVYNHRSGVGYSIEYEWHGYQSRYFPDFIVRAKLGEVFHNVILEVKGRLDARDRAKAKRGREYCELLSQYDEEPWHYLLLLENPSEGRQDISWWRDRSSTEIAAGIGDLLKHHEGLPLLPANVSRPPSALPFEVLADVESAAKFRRALPVYDLAVAAGAFGESQAPEAVGWALVQPSHVLDARMFLAQVRGRSMEEGVVDGSWCVFRAFPPGSAPPPSALDGKRLLVQLREGADPELGGHYTLKRWRVAARDADGHVARIELVPDNPTYRASAFEAADGELRAVAELLEVIG